MCGAIYLPAVQEFLKRAQKAGLALLAFLLVALGLPLLDATAETPGLEVQLIADPQGAVHPGDSISYAYSILNGTGITLPDLSVEGFLPAGLTPTMTDTPIIIPAFGLAAADDFGSGGFDGSTGSQPWAGPWAEGPEVDGPGAGDIQFGVLDTDAVAWLLGNG